jgi:HEAT repeat protein
VRNWATFAVGRQLDFDSAALRDALWERVTDESQDVREEAIAGLARRRDRRVLPLVAQLLDSGDVPSWFFDAAASLADASLVPGLLKFDETDELVARALSWCDPARRAARERSMATFLDETQRLIGERSPGAVVATWCDVLDVDVLVGVRVNNDEHLGSVDHILAGADDDPFAAARRWVDIVTSVDDDSRRY